MRKKIGIFAMPVLAIILFVGAVRGPDIYFLIKKNFTIFSEVYRQVSLNYVDEVDPQKLMRKGINAMLQSLDPYTVFIDEADRQQLDIITQGSYGGIGINVGIRNGEIVVISPLESYPAYRKGIRAGDIITSVDGIPTDGLTPDDVEELTIGEPGSTVSMTIQRYGAGALTFKLQRERIEVKNVGYAGYVDTAKTIGYISLNQFSQRAANEMRESLEKLQADSSLKGLILDLRNNPGGLVNEAVEVVADFVDTGVSVVKTRGRTVEQQQNFKTKEAPIAKSLPLIILQNKGSASASEIVAGAMQDLDRAVIMGTQSFGKGLVQIIKPLSYNTALKITAARYYIPSGRSIQAVTYRHDDSNSAIEKPDSLRKAFKTRDGRTVYDGEGIAPDIEIRTPRPSLLETSLLQQNLFAKFVNYYAAQHDSYTAARLPDEVFKEFEVFLKQQHFTYNSPTGRYINDIEERFKKMGAKQATEKHIKALQGVLKHQKKVAFDRQSKQLKAILHLQLIGRYHGRHARNEASLETDSLIKKAVDVLKSPEVYKKILAGPS